MQFSDSQVDLRATFTASQHGSVLHAPKFRRKTLVCAKEVNIYDRTCEGSLNVCTLIYPQRFATDVLKTHSITFGSILTEGVLRLPRKISKVSGELGHNKQQKSNCRFVTRVPVYKTKPKSSTLVI